MKTTFTLCLVITLMSVACSPSQKSDSGRSDLQELTGEVKMDGSSTVYPVSEAVAEEFRTIQPRVKVTIGSSGSGAGFKKFARGETDISNASRAIKENEISACKKGNVRYKELRIALDGIAIVVNKDNNWVESITTAELKQIWAPNNTVTNWNDVRPDWPNEKIHLYGPSTAHGTYDFFTEEINGEAGASRSDFNAVSDYNVAVQGIASNVHALGYFGLAYFNENADKLKLLAVDNGSGAIKPSVETVSNGQYAPLARPLYIYVNEESLKRLEVKELVQFYVSSAGELAKSVGYIPLPQVEYENSLSELKTPGAN